MYVRRSDFLPTSPPAVLLSTSVSAHLSVCPHYYRLSVRPFVCLSVRLPASRSVCLTICSFLRLSVCPFVRLSVCLAVFLYIHPAVRPFITRSVLPSVNHSVRPYVHPSGRFSRPLSLTPFVKISRMLSWLPLIQPLSQRHVVPWLLHPTKSCHCHAKLYLLPLCKTQVYPIRTYTSIQILKYTPELCLYRATQQCHS